MKRPTPTEQAALEAAFSLADAIDAINGHDTAENEKTAPRAMKIPNSSTRQVGHRRLRKTIAQDPEHEKQIRWRNPADPWHGWAFVGLELIDGGGNRYGQDEIRAIFYTRRRLRHLENALAALRPPPAPPAPQQLTLGFPQAWQVLATR